MDSSRDRLGGGIRQTAEVVHVSSIASKQCPECDFHTAAARDIGDVINHYLGHGYRLIHVGSETNYATVDSLCHYTVAILER